MEIGCADVECPLLFSVAVAHGFLYAIGGQGEDETLNAVERYDPHADTWEMVASMKIRRSSAAVAVHRNFIYIIGGATKKKTRQKRLRWNGLTAGRGPR